MNNYDTGFGFDKYGAFDPNAGAPMSVDEQMKARIAQMPPGPEKEAALARLLRSYGDESALAGEQLVRGYQMADTPMAQGTQIGGRYGTFVAASPLEHMANALRQYQGFRDVRSAKEKLEELAKEQEEARKTAFRSTLGGGTRYGITGRGY